MRQGIRRGYSHVLVDHQASKSHKAASLTSVCFSESPIILGAECCEQSMSEAGKSY